MERKEDDNEKDKKTVILPAGELTSIPRYETEGNILYVLDEDSLRLRTVSTGSAEGADMVTVTKIIAGLPDNDLERIPMTEKQGEVSCDLLYVSYKVTEESEEGMPLKYEALCWYGGLSKYEVDYDAAWEATMTYTGHIFMNMRIRLWKSEIWEGKAQGQWLKDRRQLRQKQEIQKRWRRKKCLWQQRKRQNQS